MPTDPSPQPIKAENIVSGSGRSVLVSTAAKLGVPIGVFGVTFFLIALALTIVFSPDRFPVRVGDKTVRLYELESEEKNLKVRHADLLEERQKILANADAPVLAQIGKLRTLTTPVGSAMLRVDDVRRSFRTPSHDPISLPGVTFDAEARTLTLTGDVRDPGGRSMQILASFIDELREIAIVESVSEPEYTSEPLPLGGTLSHFSVTLRFRS